MQNQTHVDSKDLGALADDARALMSATADVAGEKVGEARKRLASALENAKKIIVRVEEKAIEGAKVADKVVHEHPYQAMFVALGVGALIGYLAARRGCCKGD